jgi:hypothetical protein
VAERSVYPSVELNTARAALGLVRDEPTPADLAIEEMANIFELALLASTSPRYFRFVNRRGTRCCDHVTRSGKKCCSKIAARF